VALRSLNGHGTGGAGRSARSGNAPSASPRVMQRDIMEKDPMFSHCKRSLFVRRLLVTPAALVALAAGGDERLGADEDPAVIPERYITIADEALNIDSVATYAVEGGVRLAATAKSGHLLRVYDAATGALIDDVGGPGD